MVGGSGIPTQVSLWQSGHLTAMQGYIERWPLGLAEAYPCLYVPELLVHSSSHFIFSGWASKVRRWLWVVFLSFMVAFRHGNGASGSVLWSVNTRSACEVGGSSLAPPVSSECHPFLKPRVCVCVCVLMSFLIWFLKKFNEIDNLLFLHVSFLHLGFELKFHLILHSLSWSHSC